jgi:hypothetical protein
MNAKDQEVINCYRKECQKNNPNHIMDIPNARRSIIYKVSKECNISEEEACKRIDAYEKFDIESRKL